MFGRQMVGALLVLVGMISFFWGGVALLIERTDAGNSPMVTRTPGETRLLPPVGIALTLAGGVLLLSSARRFA